MTYRAPGKCPVCNHELMITRLSCDHCKTTIEGSFEPCDFCRLEQDEYDFLKIFIKCRGNIKDVEREMGISYPTVKSKLNNLIESLGFEVEKEEKKTNQEIGLAKEKILTDLENGLISAQDASERLKSIGQQ